jgi:hypothetical protein
MAKTAIAWLRKPFQTTTYTLKISISPVPWRDAGPIAGGPHGAATPIKCPLYETATELCNNPYHDANRGTNHRHWQNALAARFTSNTGVHKERRARHGG